MTSKCFFSSDRILSSSFLNCLKFIDKKALCVRKFIWRWSIVTLSRLTTHQSLLFIRVLEVVPGHGVEVDDVVGVKHHLAFLLL